MTTPPTNTTFTATPVTPVTATTRIPVPVIDVTLTAVTDAAPMPVIDTAPAAMGTASTAATGGVPATTDTTSGTVIDGAPAAMGTTPAVVAVGTSVIDGASVAPADRIRLFQLASVLLTYPDAELLGAADELRGAAAGIGHPWLRGQVEEFLAWLTGTAPIDAQRHYVRTFDLRRKSGLYLTYYLHGDTRRRGMALLVLKRRYRAHGLRLAAGELPDLLPVVLEFAAVVGPGEGEAPLRQHRRGVELLRAALADLGTPYGLLLDAITAVLPELTDADRAAIAELALDGPPVESVGLDTPGPNPCGPGSPGLDPSGLNPCGPGSPGLGSLGPDLLSLGFPGRDLDLHGDELGGIGLAPYPTPSSEDLR
ncbi:nitrate reductase molybdenum cofactor assembly chaperone [Streptosporangium sp. NPDC020072]|uniref:nitrate reductase molybdenum cofactor assembly chaperone n=1 Tax=Streptosporangium sp. NPDC020072 TaxID=3154788 RepID=UPI003416AAFE